MKHGVLAASAVALLAFGGCASLEEKVVKEWDNIDQTVKPLIYLAKTNMTPTPRPPVADSVEWAEQGWTMEEREWFWHIPQGTAIMPYDWFLALEQPKSDGKGAFADSAYLARYGFIPAPKGSYNPDGLPIGFVKDEKFKDPFTGQVATMAGITCAACHTGQINYNGKGMVIDGGQAMINVTLFQNKIAVTLAETMLDSSKYDRFAKKVLGESYNDETKAALKKKVKAFAESNARYSNAMINGNLYEVEEGFGRVDALARIGNFVFGAELDLANLRPVAAPVSYPPIWTAPWFDWAQYNGSIRQPMVRNVGEALGVQALVNLVDKDKLFESSVHVDHLFHIEEQLAGKKPLGGLQGPKWPEALLGPIDQGRAAMGKTLYNQHCVQCHLPPVDSPEIMEERHWETVTVGGLEQKLLKTHNIPLKTIGTDPAEVTDFFARRADATKLGLPGMTHANDGLKVVTEAVANKWYDDNGIDKKQRIVMDGIRENVVLRPLKYRARPLNGIWATPPFLHNGSVANLYELLSPMSERTLRFYTGSKEFDPVKVGYQTTKFTGAFLMDTTLPGNANTGHLYDDGKGIGIIGPKLTEKERWALVEYLKTL